MNSLKPAVTCSVMAPATISMRIRRRGGERRFPDTATKSPLFDSAAKTPERWDDIPPASTNYEASRDAMRQRIEALLDRLARARDSGRPR